MAYTKVFRNHDRSHSNIMLFFLIICTNSREQNSVKSTDKPSSSSNFNIYKDQKFQHQNNIHFSSPKELDIIKCTFSNMQTQGNGGAIYATKYCRFYVQNTIFAHCYASGQGGSVYAVTNQEPCDSLSSVPQESQNIL